MGVSLFSLVFFVCVSICFAGTLCTPEEIEVQNFKKLATANNELAVNLYRRISSQSSQNIFFSPFSLSSAFGMLYYGAKGNTAKELRTALGYETADLPEGLVHQTFRHYLTNALDGRDPQAYVLKSANAALLDRNLDLIPSYKADIRDLYQALVKDVDFLKEGQQTVQDINNWVRANTNGKIEKLLDELDSSTALVLLNAVYFKGTWKTEFNPSKTIPQKFYNNGLDSNAKEVPMMRMTENLGYAEYKNIEAVELPYKGENISMIILLPRFRDGLKDFENSLSLEALGDIRRELYKTKVELTLPKFKIQDSREMSGDFQSMGAKSAFSPGADFSGIASGKNILVSQVLHKAVVEVNEEGSEAAAVTGIIANRMRPIFDFPPEVVVDHPFLFAIVDKRYDMILFVGRVTKL